MRTLLMIKRAVAILLAVTQGFLGVPMDLEALPAVPLAVVVNKTIPQVDPVPLVPRFSSQPTREEIFRARVFGQPVLAIGGAPSAVENQALANALLHFHQGSGLARY